MAKRAELTSEAIVGALFSCQSNYSQTASRLNVSPATLRRRLKAEPSILGKLNKIYDPSIEIAGVVIRTAMQTTDASFLISFKLHEMMYEPNSMELKLGSQST